MDNSRNKLLFLLSLALIFYCFDFFFRISQSIIVPQLIQQYATDTLGIGGFASAFYIGYAIMQIPSGIMLDRMNFNVIFALSIILCSLSFLGFTLSHHYYLGYLFRYLMGMTSAFSFISVLYLARAYFPPESFSLIAGIAISLGTFSAASVQAIGAYLIKYFNWHSIFAVFFVIAFIVGLVIVLPSLSLKNNQASKKQKQAFSLKQIFHICKSQIIIRNAVIGSLFYLPTTLFASLWGIPFLQQTYQLSKQTASLGIMVLFLGWAIGSPIMGYVVRNSYKSHLYIFVGSIVGLMTSIVLLYIHVSMILMWLLLLTFGLASSAQSVVWRVFDVHCPAQYQGFAISYTNMIIMISSAFFHFIVGWLLSYHLIVTHNEHFNFIVGLSIIPLAFFVVALLSLTLGSARSMNTQKSLDNAAI